MAEVGTDNAPRQFEFAPRNPKGICSVCGAPAWDGRATKCDLHRTGKPAVKRSDTTIKIDTPRAVGPTAKTPDSKAARALELEASILRDLNPVLVQGLIFVMRPIPPETFVTAQADGTGTLTEAGNLLLITPGEAKMLGKAAAELETSPIAQMATGMAAPLMPYGYGIAALAMLAFHGMKVTQMRASLMAQMVEQQRLAAQSNGAVPMGPTAVPDDPTMVHEPPVQSWGSRPAFTPEQVATG